MRIFVLLFGFFGSAGRNKLGIEKVILHSLVHIEIRVYRKKKKRYVWPIYSRKLFEITLILVFEIME